MKLKDKNSLNKIIKILNTASVASLDRVKREEDDPDTDSGEVVRYFNGYADGLQYALDIIEGNSSDNN